MGRRPQDTVDMRRLHHTASRGMTQERLVLDRALPECLRATLGARRPCSRATTTRHGDEKATAGGALATAVVPVSSG